MWCENCKCKVEPVETFEEDYYPEVDAWEKIQIMKCPDCGSELMYSADKCECGEYKCEKDEYCKSCEETVKEVLSEAVDKLEKATGLDCMGAIDLLAYKLEM